MPQITRSMCLMSQVKIAELPESSQDKKYQALQKFTMGTVGCLLSLYLWKLFRNLHMSTATGQYFWGFC
ncbi:hypothetical protein OSCI_1500002 [Kamptonema sp. PCC 6506]|nr:hypothetical protein OSCI_1500002 [Kamptonema sp. PCC 6506]